MHLKCDRILLGMVAACFVYFVLGSQLLGQDLTVQITPSQEAFIQVGGSLGFTSIPKGGCPPYQYNWSFVNSSNAGGTPSDSTLQNPTITFNQLSDIDSQTGNSLAFPVTLTVTDSKGNTATASTSVAVIDVNNDPSRGSSVTDEEVAGAKYRKIALNGRPLSDEKPQQKEETDTEKEETYIDALNLGLNHNTTDIYVPIAGSDLSLSVRRNKTSEIWTPELELQPLEKPDEPFGSGWSSNLTPNIKWQHSTASHAAWTIGEEVYVTDENGATFKFLTTDTYYYPIPTSKNQQDNPEVSLQKNTDGTFVLTKKFGTKLIFSSRPSLADIQNGAVTQLLNRVVNSNRLTGSFINGVEVPPSVKFEYAYSRLIKIVDRAGIEVRPAYD